MCCKDFNIPNELVHKIKSNESYSCTEDEDYDDFELDLEIFENKSSNRYISISCLFSSSQSKCAIEGLCEGKFI